MGISSVVLFHLKGGDHLPCCMQCAFEPHLGIRRRGLIVRRRTGNPVATYDPGPFSDD